MNKSSEKITFNAMLQESYEQGYEVGKAESRKHFAFLVEQMGMQGYGTLAIAAAIRQGVSANANQDMCEM